MTIAETISARLTLDTSDFNRGILEAIMILRQLTSESSGSSTMFAGLNSAVSSVAGTLAGRFVNALAGGSQSVNSFAVNALKAMLGASTGVGQSMNAIISSVFSIATAAPGAAARSETIANLIKKPFQSLEGSVFGIMSNVGQGLINGLNARRGQIIATAKGIANAAIGTLRSVLRIASPSKVMRTIGEQTAQGFALGLGDMHPDIVRRAGMMANAVAGQNYAYDEGALRSGDGMSALADRLDSLISLLSGGEQVMQVDGRAFARLIREYS